jgi:radical SAM-linked protein
MPSQPVQQPPPVQRLRIRYAKRGRMRFTSHRDFSRAFERAIRRAGLPMAYSSGYTPHPRISYANAAPTGALSEAEYLEIGLTRTCDPAEIRERLDRALPAGLDVVDVVVAAPGSPALADRLQASIWRVELPGVSTDDAARAVEMFLDCETIMVERLTKRGIRTFDCRAAVRRLDIVANGAAAPECATIEMVVRHGIPSVRPDDVLAGLCLIASLVPSAPPLQSRSAQGLLDHDTGSVDDPLDYDRAGV